MSSFLNCKQDLSDSEEENNSNVTLLVQEESLSFNLGEEVLPSIDTVQVLLEEAPAELQREEEERLAFIDNNQFPRNRSARVQIAVMKFVQYLDGITADFLLNWINGWLTTINFETLPDDELILAIDQIYQYCDSNHIDVGTVRLQGKIVLDNDEEELDEEILEETIGITNTVKSSKVISEDTIYENKEHPVDSFSTPEDQVVFDNFGKILTNFDDFDVGNFEDDWEQIKLLPDLSPPYTKAENFTMYNRFHSKLLESGRDFLAPQYDGQYRDIHLIEFWRKRYGFSDFVFPHGIWMYLNGWSEVRISKLKNLFGSKRNRLVQTKRAPKQDYFEHKFYAKVWQIPKVICSRVPKPQTYSVSTFKRWVLGEAHYLNGKIPINWYATGSGCTQTLFYGASHLNRRLVLEFFIRAAVYAEPYESVGNPNFNRVMVLCATPKLEKAIGKCVLDIHGTPLTSVSKLDSIKEIFETKSRKLLFRQCRSYIEGTSSYNPYVLQYQLNQSFPSPEDAAVVTYQGKLTNFAEKCIWDICDYYSSLQVESTFNTIVPNEEFLRMCTLTVTTLFSLSKVTSLTQGISIALSFISGSEYISRLFYESFMNLSTTVFQGNDDSEKSRIPSDFWNLWAECGLATILSVSPMKGWLYPLASEQLKNFKLVAHNVTSKVIIERILEGITEVFRRLYKCYQEQSIDPLFGPSWDPTIWCKHSSGLVVNYVDLTVQQSVTPSAIKNLRKLVEEGCIPSEWNEPVPPQLYLHRLSLHNEIGKKMASYYSSNPAISRMLTITLNKAESHYHTVARSIGGCNERVRPLLVVLYGPGGVGKSNMCQEIINAVCSRFGLSNGPEGVYNWASNANFQDGFTHTHHTVIFDDVDHSAAKPTAGIPTHIESINSLVNSKPFPIEKADVELKGKHFAFPSLVILCTNFQESNVELNSLYPIAFRRRITFHVTVGVNPKYSDPSGLLLDAKVGQDVSSEELYTLILSEYEGKTMADKVLVPKVKIGFTAFVRKLGDTLQTHKNREFKRLSARALMTGRCNLCGIMISSKKADRGVDETQEAEVCPCSNNPDGVAIPVITTQGLDQSVVVTSIMTCLLFYISYLLYFNFRSTIYKLLYLSNRLSLLASIEFKNLKRNLLLSLAGTGVVVSSILLFRKTYSMQGREGNQHSGESPMDFFRNPVIQSETLPSHGYTRVSFTKEDLIRSVEGNMIEVLSPVGVWASVLTHNTILIVTHAILSDGGNGDPFETIRIKQRGVELVTRIPGNYIRVPSNKEFCILRVGNLCGETGLLTRFPVSLDTSVCQFDAMEFWSNKQEKIVPSNRIVTSRGCMILSTPIRTIEGDCGKLYLGCHNSKWTIVGVHYAQSETMLATTTMAGLMSQDELKPLMLGLCSIPAPVVISQGTFHENLKEPLKLLPLDRKKSEAWAAQTNYNIQFPTLGRVVPELPGSTARSKTRRSILAHYFEEDELKYCGDRPWVPSDMKGVTNYSLGLVDTEGRPIKTWNSPYTNSFATTNQVSPDAFTLKLALADFLKDIQHLDTSGYRALSLTECINGIPNSFVNSINMKTSAGPPLNCSKVNHVFPRTPEEECLSPEVRKLYEEAEEMLEYGEIPSWHSICTIKDEGVRLGKVSRIFNVLPVSSNIIMKKYGSPFKSFLRSNFQHFESAVGINMTSQEANKVVYALQRVDPTLKRLYDGDIKAMDKSWSGDLFDVVALVIYALTFIVCGHKIARKAWLCAHAMKHVTYSIKGDVHRVFQNPSGNDWTVEFNGILESIAERYVYYREHPFTGNHQEVEKWYSTFFLAPFHEIEKLEFRDNVALVSYGDDNVKACRYALTDDYAKIWKEELGIIVTPADKTELFFVMKELKEITFLKRSFVWREELCLYLVPLDMKSLIRTLVIKKDSSLSDKDHAATAMSCVQRELVYYGKEVFDEWTARFRTIAEAEGISKNDYLVLHSYEHYYELIKQSQFQTWGNFKKGFASLENADYSDLF